MENVVLRKGMGTNKTEQTKASLDCRPLSSCFLQELSVLLLALSVAKREEFSCCKLTNTAMHDKLISSIKICIRSLLIHLNKIEICWKVLMCCWKMKNNWSMPKLFCWKRFSILSNWSFHCYGQLFLLFVVNSSMYLPLLHTLYHCAVVLYLQLVQIQESTFNNSAKAMAQ